MLFFYAKIAYTNYSTPYTMLIGCHVSIAGGIFEAPKRAAGLGCETFQMFTRSPQGGKASELTPETIKKFKLEAKSYKLENYYIHTPYYINFASSNNRIRYGSVSVVRDELERANLLGAQYVMTHLGTTKDLGQKEAILKTIEMLKKSLEGYAGKTKLLIENSAGAGEIIGDDFSEIGEIVQGVGSESIAGICLDTQHSFASGYDWRTKESFEKSMGRIDKELGLEFVKLIHTNDSQTECGSRKDRHEHIGKGLIGTEGFQNFVAFAKEKNIDMILETEHNRVEKDIELMKMVSSELSKKYASNEYVKDFTEKVNSASFLAEGSEAPDIEMPDTSGKMIRLSSLRGSYVLVEFWASWCGPCRMSNPQLIAVYNQFKDKNFKIYGVSLDKKRESWISAINTDKLAWIQVSDLKYWESAAAIQYRVSSIPYSVLLDPKGRIIAKELRPDELKNKLNTLLK